MERADLTAQQELQNRTFIEAAARVQNDLSRESLEAYLNALSNVTFLCPVRQSEAGVEFYVTHYRPSPDPLFPVFTSSEEHEAFASVIPPGYGVHIMAAVSLCQMAVEHFPVTATLAVNPARPSFFRVPPNLIRMVAAAEWQPTTPT